MNFSIMIDLIFVLSCCKDKGVIVTNHVTKRFFFKKRTISSLLSHKKCVDVRVQSSARRGFLSTSDVCLGSRSVTWSQRLMTPRSVTRLRE